MSSSKTRRASRLLVAVLASVLAILGLLPAAAQAANGPQVFTLGTAPFLGDLRGLALNSPILDFAPTPAGNGYWEVASDGGIFTFGSAQFFGSTGSVRLNQPIVALAPTRTGMGYYLMAKDGGIFAFGDATFFGSNGAAGGEHVDLVVDPARGGYWLLGANGAVTAFGPTGAASQAAPASLPAGVKAIALASTPTGNGLWVAYSDGRIDQVGDAADFGDGPAGFVPVDLAAATDGSGLWLVDAAGRVEALGGVTRSDDVVTDRPVVAIAAHSADGYWVANQGNGPGSIAGRVLDDLGNPVAGLCVATTSFFGPTTTTGVDGRFSMNAPVGTYRIRFGGCAGDDRYLSEYYKNASSLSDATAVTVNPSATTTLDDVNVDRSSSITGVITKPDGTPLAGACAFAFDGTFGNQVGTSVTGYYRIGGLRASSYQVQFNDCTRDEYLAEFYDDAPTADLATPVAVAVGATRSGIDAQLAKAGAITGTVATADGGALGTNDACVTASDDFGTFKQAPILTGAYRLTGLGTGSYKVHFNDCVFGPGSFGGPNDYLDEWWNDQPTDATAALVSVTAGQDTTGVDATLARASTISGVVTQANGSPMPFECVDAVAGSASVRRTTTSNTGYYQLKGLRPGSYNVRFGGCTGGGNTATEWWPNAPSLAASTPVPLSSAQQRTGIDATLDPAGFLTGSVADNSGHPVRACVDVYDEAVLLDRQVANLNGITGNYRVGGLNNNSYKIRFSDCTPGTTTPLATEWFQDAASKADAAPVGAIAGQTLTVPTATLDPEGVISGTVTSETGQPLAGVCVRPFANGEDVTAGQSTVATTVTGFYRVQRLPSSTYRVQFDTRCGSSTYVGEWWNDQSSLANATPVTVTSGATTPSIDAVLARRAGAPGGLPAAPSTVSAVAGRRSATVTWSGVANSNGTITGYRITTNPGGAVRDVAADARSTTVDGLSPGQQYTFTVQARNAFGTGPGTTSNAVRPTGAPGAPGRPTATPGNGSVALSWTAADPNGEAITSYVVTASDGTELRVGDVTSAIFSPLANGAPLSFTVRAVNAAGDGPPSAASDLVTPRAPATLPSTPSTPDPSSIIAGQTSTTPLVPGSEIVFRGGGFGANQPGEVVINSTPRKLGTFVADANGSFTVVVTIPADMELGPHTLVAVGTGADGQVRSLSSPVVVVSPAAKNGYRLVAADGGIFAFGDAPFAGSAGGTTLAKPFAAGASTPSGKGYWLAGADGLVLTFGDANFHGSLAGTKLNQPIVGMAATPTGRGYWLVATDGGIFAFGDATFLGSTGDLRLNKPIVGMASTPTGKGYWLVASDGGIFAFGDAVFQGSTGDLKLNKPIVGMAASPTGEGYWLVASDGGIFSFGDAAFHGSTGDIRLNQPIVAMAATPTGRGYRLVASDGGIFTFGDASFLGSTGDLQLVKPILAIV